MIYYLNGVLTELSPQFAVVECGGVAYGVTITQKTYEKLVSDGGIGPDGECTGLVVKIYTIVKIKDENSFETYGFINRSERGMFSLLQTVSGVGPKAALAILSVLAPEDVCDAIRTDDVRRISTAQGVGTKAAQKICIDLKSKIDQFVLEFGVGGEQNVSRETILEKQQNLDQNQKLALDALINLGYTKTQAQKALSKAQGDTVEELIRTSLSLLF